MFQHVWADMNYSDKVEREAGGMAQGNQAALFKDGYALELLFEANEHVAGAIDDADAILGMQGSLIITGIE